MSAASGPEPVTLLTCDDALADRVVGLAAVAGAVVDRPVLPVRSARPPASWATAPLVLVGPDVADPAHPAHPHGLRSVARRDAVVVLAPSPAENDLWRHALGLGADHVAVLPQGENWLLDRLADAAAGPPGGLVVAVAGGRGGAGASTLAAVLALAAARRRASVLLVDGDPLGGGIDLLLGAEDVPGLRWADVAGVRGRLQPGLLTGACPTVDGVRLLSWGAGPLGARAVVPVAGAEGAAERVGESGGRPEATPEAVRAVLDAAVREVQLTVVDLARGGAADRDAVLERCRSALVVVPAEVRAAAAAARLVDVAREHAADVRLVVRGPSPAGVPARAVADLLDLPLEAALPPEPGIAALLDRGEVAAVRRRGALSRFADRFVADLLGGPVPPDGDEGWSGP